MDPPIAVRRGETDSHVRLKRLALLWSQANGYSACAAEVSLPQCRYRADVAAYRPQGKQPGVTAIFECSRVLREFSALQNRLNGGRKFECLVRYHCANLFFLVLPGQLFCESEVPLGWGALVEANSSLTLVRKPVWHDNTAETHFRFLQRIARAGTRQFNRALGITREEIVAAAKSVGTALPGRD